MRGIQAMWYFVFILLLLFLVPHLLLRSSFYSSSSMFMTYVCVYICTYSYTHICLIIILNGRENYVTLSFSVWLILLNVPLCFLECSILFLHGWMRFHCADRAHCLRPFTMLMSMQTGGCLDRHEQHGNNRKCGIISSILTHIPWAYFSPSFYSLLCLRAFLCTQEASGLPLSTTWNWGKF